MSDVLMNPTFPQEELDKARVRAKAAWPPRKDDANGIYAGNVSSILRYGKTTHTGRS
ncbi:MAG: hypothetical protein R2778_02230 [Saprospiraceae bacterium]